MRKRLVLGSGALLLAVLVSLVVWQGSFNFGPFAPTNIQQTYLFWAVSTLIFILTVTLGFILFRTGVKLYIERQANRPGSHIKSKLIAGALALTVLPVFFLVLWSVSVLDLNLDKWFSRPAQKINTDVIQVANALNQEVQDKLTAQAHWLASLAVGENADFYERFCAANRIEHAEIVNREGMSRVLCSLSPSHEGSLYQAQVKTAAGLVVLSARMPLALAAKQQEINGYMSEYNQVAADRKAFRNLYLLLLMLITLFILLLATWIARYMAGQISAPDHCAAQGGRAVRKGNLGYRVQVRAIDEMATLVRAFNEMTDELETNSRELEAAAGSPKRFWKASRQA